MSYVPIWKFKRNHGPYANRLGFFNVPPEDAEALIAEGVAQPITVGFSRFKRRDFSDPKAGKVTKVPKEKPIVEPVIEIADETNEGETNEDETNEIDPLTE